MIEIDGNRWFCNTCSHDWAATPARKFASLDDLIRRTGLRRDEVVTLAKAAEFYSVPSLIAPGAA